MADEKHNIPLILTRYKNKIASSIGDGGQVGLDDGGKITWSWCSDPRYPSPRHAFFSYQNANNSVHRSGIFDTETGQIIADRSK